MKVLDSIAPGAHWFLRLGLSAVFLYHGLTKFPNLNQLAAMMNMSVFMVFLLAMMETVGAVLILIGGVSKDWMTRIGALLFVPVMLGAIFKVHWGQWSFTPSESHPMGGIEFQVILLCLSLYLFIKGNGVKVGKAVAKASS